MRGDTADISATTSWRGSPPRSRPRRISVRPSLRACKRRRPRHRDRDLAQRRDRRQQVAAGVVARRRHRRQRLRRRHEHRVGEAARPHRDDAEADAREDVGVVGLVDLERPAVAHQRRERAAGADHGAAVAPALDVGRRRLGARGRIGQREDHRPRDCSRPWRARSARRTSRAGPTRRSASSAWRCAPRRAASRGRAARAATPPTADAVLHERLLERR